MAQLKDFIFVTTLVLALKKIQNGKIKQKMTVFIHTQKQKQLSVKVTLMIMYLDKSIPQLYQTHKNL